MICDKKECTGCYACYNICPTNSITMEEDKNGNVYPYINEKTCIKCGLCEKVCPQLKEKLDFNVPIKAYAMYNKNMKERLESTSGGAATIFYKYILKNKGVVYGVSNLFGEKDLHFIRIDNTSDLYKVKGSKYVHCYIKDTYKNIKKDLLDGKNVLFVGTPCQVAGLKSYLMKEYENLITVDIICHGVPSQKLLFDEIKNLKIDYKDVYFISFRDIKMYNFKLLDKNNNILFEKKSNSTYYLKNFLEGNFFRENCYDCRYAQRKRISDITIGDFWGLDKNSKIYDDESKGISLVMPNTKKGVDLVEATKNDFNVEERSIDEACLKNRQLNKPMNKTKKYYIYDRVYSKKGYKATMKKLESIKDIIKKILSKSNFLKKLYKKISL